MTGGHVVLALGSNLGDRLANLQGAVDAVFCPPELTFVAVSPVYQTQPVGGPPQADYLNAVVTATTAVPARTVLQLAQGVEKAFHRTREVRWGPRTLDVDIIVCGDEVSDDPELTLPHPRAHERAFVLLPWLDVDPDAALPGSGRVADLLAAVPVTGVQRYDGAIRPPRRGA